MRQKWGRTRWPILDHAGDTQGNCNQFRAIEFLAVIVKLQLVVKRSAQKRLGGALHGIDLICGHQQDFTIRSLLGIEKHLRLFKLCAHSRHGALNVDRTIRYQLHSNPDMAPFAPALPPKYRLCDGVSVQPTARNNRTWTNCCNNAISPAQCIRRNRAGHQHACHDHRGGACEVHRREKPTFASPARNNNPMISRTRYTIFKKST